MVYRKRAAGHTVHKNVMYFKNNNRAHRVLNVITSYACSHIITSPAARLSPFRFLYLHFLFSAFMKECE